MTKQDYIEFWLKQANDDWGAVITLYKGKKYLQSLFFTHLVIEKICKSIWIKYNLENVPPRTHNLIYLLSFTPIKLSEKISEFMLSLNRFQLEGRYPNYLTEMYQLCDKKFTNSMINKAEKVRLWLIEKLQ